MTVVDFGAGHLTETEILRAAGVRVSAFEPYRIRKGGNEIDKQASLELSARFLDDVAAGVRYSSVFVSSVLNSVTFASDRRHIVRICAALCHPKTRLYAVASSIRQVGSKTLRGASYLSDRHAGALMFALDYEPGISVGDIQQAPKVQKYHEAGEFYGLFKEHFDAVRVTEASNNVQAECAQPLPLDKDALVKSLRFEFELPYPDGSTMSLSERAISAFEKRGVL